MAWDRCIGLFKVESWMMEAWNWSYETGSHMSKYTGRTDNYLLHVLQLPFYMSIFIWIDLILNL